MRRIIVTFALSLAACAGYGEGSAEIQGDVRVPRCTLAGVGTYLEGRFPAFTLNATFFSAERHGDVLGITVRRDTRPFSDNDVLAMDVRDVTRITVGEPIDVRPDDAFAGSAAPVRLALSLKSTCPRFETGLVGRGTVTFNALDARQGGLVDATFTVDLLDAQATRQTGTTVVLGSLRGRFRIPMQYPGEPG